MTTSSHFGGLGWALAAVTTVALLAPAAPGQTAYEWTSTSDGLWSDASKWAPNTGQPGDNPLDDAAILATGSPYQVTLDADATIHNFTLSSADCSFYLPSSTLTVTGDSVITAGTLNLAGGQYNQVGGTFSFLSGTAGDWNGGRIIGGPVTLTDSMLVLRALGAASFVTHGDCTLTGIQSGQVRAEQGLSVVAAGRAASFSGLGYVSGKVTLDSTTADDVTLIAMDWNQHEPSIYSEGIFNVEAGAGGKRTITGDFQNANPGTVNLNANTDFDMPNAVVGNGGFFNIGAGGSVNLNAGGQQFVMTDGALKVLGHFNMSNGTFTYQGGDIAGNPIELTSSRLALGYHTVHLILHGDCTTAGGFSDYQEISIVATGQAAKLTSSSGLSNSGTLNLDSTTANDVTVNSSGTLTNHGRINIQPGAGGKRTFIGRLFNWGGTVNVNAETQVNPIPTAVTNAGIFNIGPTGALELNNSTPAFVQQYGTLNVQGHLDITGGSFLFSGGTITGNPIEVTNGGLDLRSTAPVAFIMHGNNSITNAGGSGTIYANQVVSVVADGAPASLNSGLSLNAGTLTLDSTTAHNVSLSLPGTLTNQGVLNVLPGAGGGRIIDCDFVNQAQGTVNLSAPTQFHGGNGSVTNSGTWNLTNTNASAVLGGGTFENDGLIQGVGTIDVRAATFTNGKVIAPGLPIGKLSVLGDYHQTGVGGGLILELGGRSTPGVDYDQFTVSGTAFISGGIVIRLANGFTPELGDQFKLLDFSSAQGHLTWYGVPELEGGLAWDISTLLTDGTIRVTPEPASGMLVGLVMVMGAGMRRVRRQSRPGL